MLDEREGAGRARTSCDARLQPQAAVAARRHRRRRSGRQPAARGAAVRRRALDRRRRAEGGARHAGGRRASPSGPACAPATGCARSRPTATSWQRRALDDRPALGADPGGAATTGAACCASATRPAAARARSTLPLDALEGERCRCAGDAAHRPRRAVQRAGARPASRRVAPAAQAGLQAGDRVRQRRRRVRSPTRPRCASRSAPAAQPERAPMRWRVERAGRPIEARRAAGGRSTDGGQRVGRIEAYHRHSRRSR